MKALNGALNMSFKISVSMPQVRWGKIMSGQGLKQSLFSSSVADTDLITAAITNFPFQKLKWVPYK